MDDDLDDDLDSELGDEVDDGFHGELAPEPAPLRPGPVTAPVEGTVSWRSPTDEQGEA